MLGNRKFAMFGNGLPRHGRSINQRRAIGDRGSSPARRTPRRPPPSGPDHDREGIQLSDTIHLHDLTPAERLVEEAAERGFVEEKELEALADEHELAEDDMAALRAALDERDVIVRAEAAPSRASLQASSGGTLDPLQLFMDAAGRHKLLTAADEVHLAKRIEKGDARREGAHDQLEPAPRRLDREAVPGS